MKQLGINIDHVATLRNARGGSHPDPVAFAKACERLGVHNITFHLREDRRHVKDDDVWRLKQSTDLPLNFELACTEDILAMAFEIKPHTLTLVPEKRQELTTEGGLDLTYQTSALIKNTQRFRDVGTHVSYFIEPEISLVQMASDMGATAVEFHTGQYAEAFARGDEQATELILQALKLASQKAVALNLMVHAGHGLNLQNLPPLVAIKELTSFQIGHAIVGDAIFDGVKSTIQSYQHILSS